MSIAWLPYMQTGWWPQNRSVFTIQHWPDSGVDVTLCHIRDSFRHQCHCLLNAAVLCCMREPGTFGEFNEKSRHWSGVSLGLPHHGIMLDQAKACIAPSHTLVLHTYSSMQSVVQQARLQRRHAEVIGATALQYPSGQRISRCCSSLHLAMCIAFQLCMV